MDNPDGVTHLPRLSMENPDGVTHLRELSMDNSGGVTPSSRFLMDNSEEILCWPRKFFITCELLAIGSRAPMVNFHWVGANRPLLAI